MIPIKNTIIYMQEPFSVAGTETLYIFIRRTSRDSGHL